MEIILIIALYFLPPLVAGMRSHRNTTAIFVLTLLTGWSLFGWIAALVWACTSNTKGAEA